MRMQPSTGRALWILLHAHAKAYPAIPNGEAMEGARLFLQVFGELVKENSNGCGRCSGKWLSLIQRVPPDLSSRESFYGWTIAAHDWINREMGKPLQYPDFAVSHPIFTT